MACHLREEFENATVFISEEDVFCECYFYECKVVFYGTVHLVIGGEWADNFEGTHFDRCHLMSFAHYLSTEVQ